MIALSFDKLYNKIVSSIHSGEYHDWRQIMNGYQVDTANLAELSRIGKGSYKKYFRCSIGTCN